MDRLVTHLVEQNPAARSIDAWYSADPAVAAVDAHAHVFAHGLPLAPVVRHAPDYDATLDTYIAHLAEHGITHAVLVQPSFLGTDNTFSSMCCAVTRAAFAGSRWSIRRFRIMTSMRSTERAWSACG